MFGTKCLSKGSIDMKRFLILGSIIMLCGMSVGCGSESQDGLIKDTISLIDQSATEVGNIKERINEAVKKVEAGTTKTLDLTDAIKAAEKLKTTGVEAQKIKSRIEHVRGAVTEEQKILWAKKNQPRLNEVLANMLEKKKNLRDTMSAVEKTYPSEIANLRKKIVDAEGPFEALARQ
jgi:hypothetical protein